MPENLSSLLTCFIAQRQSLAHYLTGRTGCAATADDLLQEAWLKLSRLQGDETIDNPSAYLQRMATNLAIDDARANARRLLDPMEIDMLLEVADEAPDAEQRTADRQELERLAEIIEEMPSRRRDLFIAARIEGQQHKDLAERFGVSVRTVDLELHRALDYCAARLRELKGETAVKPALK